MRQIRYKNCAILSKLFFDYQPKSYQNEKQIVTLNKNQKVELIDFTSRNNSLINISQKVHILDVKIVLILLKISKFIKIAFQLQTKNVLEQQQTRELQSE
eukprot:TRINITY_DN2332_c1_g2_i2.p4 TRINITY_DN2332_c1_g2~~TRINITY_DN2332_c1_g2_i2.p4  ORF type:complete len:100 (-),score=0.69 TRINITY_DN2332_c1_g2_i2:335-634(-)